MLLLQGAEATMVPQPLLQPLLQAMRQPRLQPVLQAVAQPLLQPVLQAVAQPVLQPVLQAVAQPVLHGGGGNYGAAVTSATVVNRGSAAGCGPV